jgi:hypothetical protein
MLQQVLQALQTATEPVSLDELSRRLDIERSALEGMIAFWVRKGKLQESAVCGGRGPGCTCSSHPEGCVFNSNTPRTITVIADVRRG